MSRHSRNQQQVIADDLIGFHALYSTPTEQTARQLPEQLPGQLSIDEVPDDEGATSEPGPEASR